MMWTVTIKDFLGGEFKFIVPDERCAQGLKGVLWGFAMLFKVINLSDVSIKFERG